jgi:hypothetical protein
MKTTEQSQSYNLAEISVFLERYKDFSVRLERQKILHYKTKFDGLLSGYDSLKNLLEVFNKKEASQYNIFDILNIKAAEVKTHTPFLQNLLTPNGSHAQGNLFLNSFIQNFIPSEKRDFFVLSDTNDYHIEEEKPIRNGRIDIYIQSINPYKKFAIIIENKLYAADQELQLNRYYDFIRGKYTDKQIMMFYLTIHGIDPSSFSINRKLMTEVKDRKILYNLSYKTDIKYWLQNLKTNIEADKVRYLIEQYLEIIDNF